MVPTIGAIAATSPATLAATAATASALTPKPGTVRGEREDRFDHRLNKGRESNAFLIAGLDNAISFYYLWVVVCISY